MKLHGMNPLQAGLRILFCGFGSETKSCKTIPAGVISQPASGLSALVGPVSAGRHLLAVPMKSLMCQSLKVYKSPVSCLYAPWLSFC